MSIYCRELNTVEIALAAIDEADKVQFINYIKELPSEPSSSKSATRSFIPEIKLPWLHYWYSCELLTCISYI